MTPDNSLVIIIFSSMLRKKYLNTLFSKLSTIRLRLLAVLYVVGFLVVEMLVPDVIRHYNFCVLLALSGIFFAWLIGGKRSMYYVAFFSLFFVFVFSTILWNKGIIVHSGLFVAKSFMTIYVLAFLLVLLMLLRKSPADERAEQQQKAFEEARQQRQNLEFMIASRKLRQDLLAQANLVKDELLILEGAWRSKIHDIINDLPDVKERELYRQIIVPFEDNIIGHLRDLAQNLTFDPASVSLDELSRLLFLKIQTHIKTGSSCDAVEINENGWKDSPLKAVVDTNKFWDMVVNILRNSQTALELQRIEMLRSNRRNDCTPRIRIDLHAARAEATLTVTDNGGGVPPDQLVMLYREPVPSIKRQGKTMGQGTLFVKFFAERMNMTVSAVNTSVLGSAGLAVTVTIPVQKQ